MRQQAVIADLLEALADLYALLDNGDIEVWKWGPHGKDAMEAARAAIAKATEDALWTNS
jgi:hypothetical protein